MDGQEENGEEEVQFIQYDENGKQIYQTRELTTLEKQYQQDALKRQQENITKPQIVTGKVFKGDAFIPTPAQIIFKDFDVGKTHSITVTLTNVSYSFNSFKLLPLKQNIRDFFDIEFVPCGRISAGMKTTVIIRFTPVKEDDIDDFFPILAETGPINIPLICTSKKAIVKVENTSVDFKHVIYGEDQTIHLKLSNEGALLTDLVIKSAQGIDILTQTDAQSMNGSQRTLPEGMARSQLQDDYSMNLEQCLKQLQFSKVQKINGYSPLSIPIQYIPTEIGPFEIELVIYFENYLHSPPVPITIKGECIEVPIYVEKPSYDFQICLIDHIYREQIVFFNRSINAMKVQISAPQETQDFFQFNPLLGYVQGNDQFEVWVQMTINKDMKQMCAKFQREDEDDVYEIPFKLIGADQVMPVPFYIRMKVTIDTLLISPMQFGFGKLYEGTGSRIAVDFQNLSDLPQEVMFYPLPKEISLQPDLVPLQILPREQYTAYLVYRSFHIPGLQNRKDEDYLQCKIVTGTYSTQQIRIPYNAEIQKCPIEFSDLKLQFPVTQIEENHSVRVNLRNTSSQDYLIQFFLPYFQICGLQITPMVERIKSDESVEILVQYYSFFQKLGAYTLQELQEQYDNNPQKNFQLKLKQYQQQQEAAKKLKEEEAQLQAQGGAADNKGGKDAKKGAAPAKAEAPQKQEKLTQQQQQALEEEQKRQEELQKQRIEEQRLKKLEFEKNYDWRGELRKLGGRLTEFTHEDNPGQFNQHYTWLVPCYFKPVDASESSRSVIYLQISTITVDKSLLLEKTVIDFEELAVGVRKIASISVMNKSLEVAMLKMDTLPIHCGFNLINALRPVQPGVQKKPYSLSIEFLPHNQEPFEETLKIKCQTTTVSAKLKGKGVRPEVKLVPENGLLSFGGIVLGESCEKSIKITNVSNFTVKFKITSKAKGISNRNSSSVFSFVPSEGYLDAKQEIECKLIFKPDRISDQFFQLLLIDVPNQQDEKSLFIWGYCYPREAYLNYYNPYNFVPKLEALTDQLESSFDALKIKDEEKIFSPLNNKILIEFKKASMEKEDKDQKDDEACFIRKIVIGNCQIYSDPKNQKPVNFEISMPKDDQNNFFTCDNLQAAVAPGTETVVTFKFNPPQADQTISGIDALKGIGQWQELKAEIKLTGGFLKPGTNDLWSFEVILKAYINQI